MREQIFLNQGAVTVEVHTQMKSYSSNRESIRAIINHPSIHTTLIISVLNVMFGNKICTLDVDRRIISLQIVQNRTLWVRRLTGEWKSLKLMLTYRLK